MKKSHYLGSKSIGSVFLFSSLFLSPIFSEEKEGKERREREEKGFRNQATEHIFKSFQHFFLPDFSIQSTWKRVSESLVLINILFSFFLSLSLSLSKIHSLSLTLYSSIFHWFINGERGREGRRRSSSIIFHSSSSPTIKTSSSSLPFTLSLSLLLSLSLSQREKE